MLYKFPGVIVKYSVSQTIAHPTSFPFSVRQRLTHIERCLFWNGEVGRADLMDTFDVTPVQAARDFRAYLDSFPNNMSYDSTRRRYVAQAGFIPGLIQPETLDEFANMLSQRIPVAQWPLPVRRASPAVLLAVVTAVRERMKIEVQYQSMTAQEPEWRWLSPHAFARDAERWHVRAFCHSRSEFRDFVLGRILETRETTPTEVDPAHDVTWNTFVDVLVTPNPQLEAEQRQAVAAEYNLPESAELTLTLRQAMLFYVQAKFESPGRADPAANQLFVARMSPVNGGK